MRKKDGSGSWEEVFATLGDSDLQTARPAAISRAGAVAQIFQRPADFLHVTWLIALCRIGSRIWQQLLLLLLLLWYITQRICTYHLVAD